MGELKLEGLLDCEDVAKMLKLKDVKAVWRLSRKGLLRNVPGLKPMKFTKSAVLELMNQKPKK